MAKKMKNLKREQKEILEARVLLIKAALEAGLLAREDISKNTGIALHTINTILKGDKELYAEYTLRRRTIVDLAADSLQAIVADKNHPQHFAAAKYVLSKYKSDLDESLDGKEEGVTIKRRGKGGSRVKFEFR